jgi:prophage regulatory protein
MATEVRLIRLRELLGIVGLGKSRVYELVRSNEFPEPVRLTMKAVAWRSDEIQQWIDSRPPVKLSSPSP